MPYRPRRILLPVCLAVCLATGCVTPYQSPALNLATLEGPGDVQLAAHAGTPGYQISGAYAFHDAFAIRGLMQADVSESGNSHFRHLSAGASWFGSRPLGIEEESPLRVVYAASLETGLFMGQGQLSLNVGGSTGTTTYRGAGLRSALQGDVALSSPYLDLGFGARVAHLYFQHDDESSRAGETAKAIMVEPVLLVRPGAPVFKVDLQVGISVPVFLSGQIGLPLPIMVAIGGVLQL